MPSSRELPEHLAHLVGRVAEADERVAHLGARRSARRPGAPREVEVGHLEPRLQLDEQPLRGALADAGHERRASRGRPRRGSGASWSGECTDRIASASFGPDAARRDQRLERVALVARREAEQHHRVVADVQVREQERVACRARAPAPR